MILGTILRCLRRQTGLAGAAIALTGLSGCSLLFVEGPPHDHASRHFFDCTSSMVVPGMDAALAGALALSVLGVSSDQTHTTGDIVRQSALVAGALAAATYGYTKVSRCREAKADLEERLINMPYLGVPPWDPSRAPPARGGTPRAAPSPAAASSPTNPPAPRDPWLSEGPPPPPSDGRREPTLMPPPPPYLRVAPHSLPPAPPPAAASAPADAAPPPDGALAPPTPPPATAAPPAPPAPTPEPPPAPSPPPQVADPESP